MGGGWPGRTAAAAVEVSQDRERLERQFATSGRPAPAAAHDPERRLAAAIFERAVADLEGGHSIFKRSSRAERFADQFAEEWVREADEGFRFWCDVAGRDWREVRRAMLRRDRPYLRRTTRWLGR